MPTGSSAAAQQLPISSLTRSCLRILSKRHIPKEQLCFITAFSVIANLKALTICAERNAIFQAVAKGALSKDRKLKAVVIVTRAEKLTAPCGACRQVIYEFCEEADADIFIFGATGAASFKLSALLPHAFGPKDLGKE